jgi:hypothetical protein
VTRVGRKAIVPALLILALQGCADPTPPPNPKQPYPFAERIVPPPPWAGDFASGAFRLPLTVVDAEQILLRTRIFALGEMPPKRQVQAFNVLLDQADALVRFRRLVVEAEPAGQLYALAALSMLSASEAVHFGRSMADRHDEILVYDSDVLTHSQMREVVSLITERHVGEECRKLRESTDEYFRTLVNPPLQPTPRAQGNSKPRGRSRAGRS